MVDEAKLRRRILDRLRVVSEKLADILAGQDIRLPDIELPHEKDPGETKEERLRKQKDFLNGLLKRFDDGTYGTCAVCREPIPDVELEEVPWATRCRACTLDPPSPDRASSPRERRRREVLNRLGEVCDRLAAIFAEQNVTLPELKLPHEKDPKLSTEERLRIQKRFLSAVLERYEEGDEDTCLRCGGTIPEEERENLAWATACRTCVDDAPAPTPNEAGLLLIDARGRMALPADS